MKKLIIILYGLIAYVVFLIAFVYAIGFVGDFIVPKAINSGAETSFANALFINLGLLSLFAVQHSVMARPAFKKWISPVIGPAIERSTYILLTSLVLLLMYWKWKPMTSVIWHVENSSLYYIIMSVFILGWLIVFLSTFMISHFQLFGLTQIFNNFKNKHTEDPTFQTNYFYKIVRHPIMLGFMIAFWATPFMTLGHLLFAIVTTLYMLIAVKYLEERDLRKFIGEPYETYQNEVPMIVPFTKFK